jgi:S-adenosylmethionine synthetase
VLSDCKALTADELSRRVKEAFSYKPADIIEVLGLTPPIFSATTNYGHFGKADLPWEKLDQKKLDKLKS